MADKMIHIIVSTHQGRLYDEYCDYIGIKGKDGEFGILPNHVPTVTSLETGFIKLVREQIEVYIAVAGAMMEFHDNQATVLAQEAQIGTDKESALNSFEAMRKERLEQNKKLAVDYTMNEVEILDNLKKTKAGNL